ncbi:MAG: threonine/serine exporter [Oscillospiraceae bacterium]|nr:MAG: threonine/serine exporter [Oscillospiraceae bacterium]
MTGRLLVQCAVSFAAVMAFAILFHAPRREWVPCGLTGMVGWVVYWLAVQGGISVVAASFCGTLGLALLSRVLAVVRRCPVTVFLTGGIFPLVPGAGIYYTVYAFITGDNAAAVFKGVETLKIAGVIALGIVLVLALPKGVFRVFAAREKRQ